MSHSLCSLRINREGEFKVRLGMFEGQCGRQGQTDYKFFVSIQATNRHLTKEGFVMENMWVADYFEDTYSKDEELIVPSCEEMAQRAVDHFREVFATNPELKGVELERILVRIYGTKVSFIEAEWSAAREAMEKSLEDQIDAALRLHYGMPPKKD